MDQENCLNEEEEEILESNEFKKKLFERLNSISSKFKLNYPFNPKLCYEYPKINAIICQNIINSLIKYPKFYIQTLHLMNKMNLPCPLVPYIREHLNEQKVEKEISTSESEIESDTEQNEYFKSKQITQVSSPKRIKVKSILKSIKLTSESERVKKPIDLNQVFEITNEENKKKTKEINILKTYDRVIVQSESTSFPKILPINQQETQIQQEIPMDIPENDQFIKKDDIENNRLKLSELKELPVFKNYDRGEKNSRIYLKNLSKKINESDLKFVYGRYVDWKNEEHKNAFDIRLMKEGKMKGQAFISLPNEDLAEKAVNETIGYLLDGKPIVVQFARSAKPQIK